MIRSSKQQAGTSTPHMQKLLHGKTLFFWRGTWTVTVLLNLGILAYCIPGFIVQQATVCTDKTLETCGLYQLQPVQLALLARLHLSLDGYAAYIITLDALTTLALLVMGALIFWRKSNDGMGLFVSLLLITFGCFGVDEIHLGAISQPPLPIEIFGDLVLFFQWPALGFFFYLYPDGRFVPRWSWVLGSLFLIQLVCYLLPYPYDLPHWPPVARFLAELIVVGSAVGTQIYRYFAVATPLQRQQIKWLVFGFGTTLLIVLLTSLPPILFPDLNAANSWYQAANIIIFNPFILFLRYFFIPLSIGIGLLRYRLWDIDVLINRALVYGLLTGILLLLYIGLIFGGQALLVSFVGNNNPALLVISTLVVVALFRPLRHRIQTIIDRRFYRYKYNAAQTVATFSKTLQQEVDLQHLQEQLVRVVADTMQPTHVSLWLRQEKKTKQL